MTNIEQMKQKAAEQKADYQKALTAALASEKIYQDILPSKVAWMNGVAEGADVAYADALLYNSVEQAYAGFEGECTTFMAHGSALAATPSAKW
jgi:hypothetical protein